MTDDFIEVTSTEDSSQWKIHRDYDADGVLCAHVWHAPADRAHTPHRTVQASLSPFGMFAECSCHAKLRTSAPRYSPPPQMGSPYISFSPPPGMSLPTAAKPPVARFVKIENTWLNPALVESVGEHLDHALAHIVMASGATLCPALSVDDVVALLLGGDVML